MPTLSCPNCGTPTPRQLDAPSEWASVKYYRCDKCGHVWTVSRDGKEVVEHVTPLRPKDSPE